MATLREVIVRLVILGPFQNEESLSIQVVVGLRQFGALPSNYFQW